MKPPRKKSPLHPLYRRWNFIRQLCYNPNDKNYQKYGGGQGLECHFHSWPEFRDYVESTLGLPPSPQHKLHRIHAQGHYQPGNLCWAHHQEVAQSQHNCINVTYNNKTQSLSQWARELKLNYQTLTNRYHRGCTAQQILGFEPLKPLKTQDHD